MIVMFDFRISVFPTGLAGVTKKKMCNLHVVWLNYCPQLMKIIPPKIKLV